MRLASHPSTHQGSNSSCAASRRCVVALSTICKPFIYISMHTSILASLPTSTHIYTEISTYTMISAVCIFARSHNKMLKIVESRTWRCFSATATAAPKCTRIGLPPCLASIAGAQTRAKCLSRRHIYIYYIKVIKTHICYINELDREKYISCWYRLTLQSVKQLFIAKAS